MRHTTTSTNHPEAQEAMTTALLHYYQAIEKASQDMLLAARSGSVFTAELLGTTFAAWSWNRSGKVGT